MFKKVRSLFVFLLVCSLLLTSLPAPALAEEWEEVQADVVEAVSDEEADAVEAVSDEEADAVEAASDEEADSAESAANAAAEAASEEDASSGEETAAEEAEGTAAVEAEESTSSGKDTVSSAADAEEYGEASVEEPDKATETAWITVDDPTEIAHLIRDNWSDDYFQEAIVDTSRNQVTVDGQQADFSQVFDDVTEAEAEEIFVSAAAVEEYFADTAYETEVQSGGTVSVTAPYQTCRVVLTAEVLTGDYGAETILEYAAYNEYVLQFATAEDTQAAYEQLVARYGWENCYVDEVITADDLLLSDEDDTATTIYSWGTSYMGLDTLKASASTANAAVTVAIIDSGIDPDHEFFEGRTITDSSCDFLAADDEDPTELSDPYGHGTHVAGIIAECTPDNVELMVLRILDDNGSGTLALVSTAIQYALEHGADVMNLSLGVKNVNAQGNPYTYLDGVIQTAYEAGVPLCCAAGNAKTDVYYPAANELTLAVSAIKSDGSFASSFSNYGAEIDFCAPGYDIVSARTGGGTISKNGTSMAAAYVTAALTYAITACPDADVDELYSVLQDCATDLGDEGKDDYFGWGCVTGLSALFTDFDDLNLTVALSQTSYTYDGTAQEPAVTVTDADSGVLTEGTDYSVSYSDNVNAGTATVTITGVGKYTGTVTTAFTIVAAELSTCTVSAANAVYTGKALTPAVTVKDANGNTLTEGTDYTVEYSNNTDYGAGTVAVTGMGNYTGAATATFSITFATPTLSSVSNTTSGVKVTWKTVTGAAKYRVFRKTGSGSWTKLTDTTSTSYTDTTAKSGTTYKYTVRCVNSAGTSYTSSYNTTGLSITYLSAPTLSSVSSTTSGVKISWKAVSGAAKYRVFRKTGSGSWTKLADTTSTSYTDATAQSGTTYKYTVRCVNSAGTSYTSSYDSTGKTIKYLTAGKVSSLVNTSSGITVKWSKVTGASGYRIYRKTSGGSYSLIKTVTSGSTVSYTDTAVKSKNGTTYVYAVRPYSGSYTGSYTGRTTVRLTSVSISCLKNVKTRKMTVKWSKNTKATGYQIQYSTSSSFSSSKTVTVSGYKNVSKTISSLTKNKRYYVRVRAYKTVSGTKYYSAWSGKKNVKISK